MDSEQERCWRLSFQEQEKLKMEGYQNFKPALRFMKVWSQFKWLLGIVNSIYFAEIKRQPRSQNNFKLFHQNCFPIRARWTKKRILVSTFELHICSCEIWNIFGFLYFNLYLQMLKVYYKHLVQEQIPYFWNINNNLLISSKSAAIQNICNKIKRIIDSIENNFTNNPYIVANALCRYLKSV